MANANMCQLLEEEAREKEREAREAARKLKRKLKKAEARLRSQEEESAQLRAALARAELADSSSTEASPDRPAAAADSDASPAKQPPADPEQDSSAAVAPGGKARRGRKKGARRVEAAEVLARQNGGSAAQARAASADGSDKDVGSEGALPDSWEAMVEEGDSGNGAATGFNAVYGVSPPDSGSWTTVGVRKPTPAAAAVGTPEVLPLSINNRHHWHK